jgi:hypothetical protein
MILQDSQHYYHHMETTTDSPLFFCLSGHGNNDNHDNQDAIHSNAICNYHAVLYVGRLPFIFWHLNPNVATDSWSYFDFKCQCLHLCGTVFFHSAIKLYVTEHGHTISANKGYNNYELGLTCKF